MLTADLRRGFTLLETIITMSVLAVVAAMGAPRLSTALRHRTTGSAADEFVSTHALARATAIRYGRVAQLHIDASSRRFWVDVDTSATGVGQRATVWYVRDLSGSGLSMTSDRALLCFDAWGLPATTGSCEPGNITVVFADNQSADTVRTAALGKVLR